MGLVRSKWAGPSLVTVGALALLTQPLAAAQLEAVKDVIVVDANGKTVGRLANGRESRPQVVFQAGDDIFWLWLEPDGLEGLIRELFFESPDCRGQAYSRYYSTLELVQFATTAGSTVALHGLQETAEEKTASSMLDERGCRPLDPPSTETFYPGRIVGDWKDHFTPPFRVRAVTFEPQLCDADADGDIDRDDILTISSARNEAAEAGDPRDADGDGTITAGDARVCAVRCTKPNCAP